MSARRAVLLTLLAVAVVLAIVVGGFFAFREYDSVRDRAENAERELANVKNQTSSLAEDAYSRNGVFADIVTDNIDVYSGEEPKPAWYAVRIVPNTVTRRYCCVVDGALKMRPCRDHWWTPGDPETVWVSSGKSDDADCQ